MKKVLRVRMQGENSDDDFMILPLKASTVPGYVAADHPQQTINSESSSNKRKILVKFPEEYSKKRQVSKETRQLIIQKYKTDLSSVWLPDTRTFQYREEIYTLECKVLNPITKKLPIGFTLCSKTRERYQYNFTDPLREKRGRYRPNAYRMPFLDDVNFYDQSYTVSHLCHNPKCYNWDHLVLEPLWMNKGRNGCPCIGCHHFPKCISPGQDLLKLSK